MRFRPVTATALLVLLAGCGSTVAGQQAVGTGLAAGAAGAAAPGLNGGPGTAAANNLGPNAAPAGTTAGTVTSNGTPGGTAAAAPAPGAAAAPGSVGPAAAAGPVRAPITVGMLTTNNDAAASAGINNGNTFNEKQAFQAMVRAYNARGGLAGRPIRPVYVELRSSSASYPADLQAACTAFTQDAHAAVVFRVTGLYSEQFSHCLTAAHVPEVVGDYALGDDKDVADNPDMFAPTTLTADERSAAVLRQLTAAGVLTHASKIGVVVEGCPFNQRVYGDTLVPLAARLGLDLAQRVDSRCFEGISDLGGLASDMQGAVLKFQSAGVDRVIFVSSVEGNLMLLFATAAQNQQYFPQYGLTSLVAAVVQEANTPKTQLANAKGVGWLPTLDVDGYQAFATPAGRPCLADMRSAGVNPTGATDDNSAYTACDTFGFFAAVLRVTQGRTDPATVRAAVRGLGTSFLSATDYSGRTSFTGSSTGPATGREFAWASGCGCFAYTGSPFALRPGS